VQSIRGHPVDDVLDAIPDDWTVDIPKRILTEFDFKTLTVMANR